MDPKSAQPLPVTTPPSVIPTTPVASPVAQQTGVTTPPTPTSETVVDPSMPAPVKKSSKMGILLVIFVLILVVAGAWFAYSYFMNRSTSNLYKQTGQEKKMMPTVTPLPTSGFMKTGDVKIDQASEEIDENMVKIDEDLKNIDNGLNDKSVDLNY